MHGTPWRPQLATRRRTRTRAVHGTLAPVYNEEFDIAGVDEGTLLQFTLMDKDRVGAAVLAPLLLLLGGVWVGCGWGVCGWVGVGWEGTWGGACGSSSRWAGGRVGLSWARAPQPAAPPPSLC
jgi:hypothetical protein